MSPKSSLSFLGSIALILCLTGPSAAGEGHWTSVGPTVGESGINWPASIVTHPGSPKTVWVAQTQGGVLQSTNSGITWKTVGEELTRVTGLAADPSAPGALWAATPNAVLYLEDGGTHWRQTSNDSLSAALGDQEILSLAATPAATAYLYAWTWHRVLESADGGRNWRAIFNLGEDVVIFAVFPTGPGSLYLGIRGLNGYELAKTSNGGATWTSFPCPEIGEIAFSPTAIFVSPFFGSDKGIWRSTDGGSTWSLVLDGPHFSLLADPLAPGSIWALQEGYPHMLWLSRDNGETWAQRNTTGVVRLWAVGPEPGSLYGVGDSIAGSTNGGRTWASILPVAAEGGWPPCRVSFQPGQPSHIVFTKSSFLFRSNDGGTTWHWLSTAPLFVNGALLDPTDPNRVITSGSTTFNNGRSWWESRGGDSFSELLVRATPKIMFSGGCGVQRSYDNGKTWFTALSCQNPRNRRAKQIVQKLVVDPTHPSLVFALVFLKQRYYLDHGPLNGSPSILWRSEDGGRTWQSIAESLDAFDLDAQSSRLWLIRGTDLLVSADLGASWQAMAKVPLKSVTDFAVLPQWPGTLYVVGPSGLLRTRDEGRSWETLADGGAMLLAVAPNDPRTVFGMSHEGLFQLRLPE